MTTYTPKTWQTDDPITDVDLNRIEERIAEFQQLERVWMIIGLSQVDSPLEVR